MTPAYITATNRLLFDSDESASIVKVAMSTCSSANTVIAGNEEQVLLHEREAAREEHLRQQEQGGHPGHQEEECHQGRGHRRRARGA